MSQVVRLAVVVVVVVAGDAVVDVVGHAEGGVDWRTAADMDVFAGELVAAAAGVADDVVEAAAVGGGVGAAACPHIGFAGLVAGGIVVGRTEMEPRFGCVHWTRHSGHRVIRSYGEEERRVIF